jgi:hypothetical protein
MNDRLKELRKIKRESLWGALRRDYEKCISSKCPAFARHALIRNIEFGFYRHPVYHFANQLKKEDGGDIKFMKGVGKKSIQDLREHFIIGSSPQEFWMAFDGDSGSMDYAHKHQ